jgi:tetratricopeptide (TPR) repeat protein
MSAEVHYNRGNALLANGRHAEAVASYEQALELKPDDAEALNNLAVALHLLGRHAAALETVERALTLRPGYAKALHNRGNALLALKRPDEALASYGKAYAIAPDPAWMLHFGHALQALERHEEALASYDKAIAHDPRRAEAYGGRGNALQGLNRHEEALASYLRALELDPGDPETHWNEALARLALGDYARGWEKYEWRWRNPALNMAPRRSDRPLWLGREDLAGKTILLHAEQGYGDAIQAIRYAPRVAARGAKVVLLCQKSLRSLFAGVEGVHTAVKDGEPLPHFDCHTPLMSLPLAFGTTLETIPAEVPYLRPSTEALERWRRKLSPDARFKVGLAWRGNPQFGRVRTKSFPFARLLPLLASPDCAFFSLQPGAAETHDALIDYTSEFESFEDTAALIAGLDLVISIDTAVAHLAGALAKPVWILLPWHADWRWLRQREDSPWYPTARLFRQPAPGDWDSVIHLINEELWKKQNER